MPIMIRENGIPDDRFWEIMELVEKNKEVRKNATGKTRK